MTDHTKPPRRGMSPALAAEITRRSSITNGEALRTLSDESLADALLQQMEAGHVFAAGRGFTQDEREVYRYHLLTWLRRPAEESER